MDTNLPILAAPSTAIFTLSMLPMLVKAARTRELRSYSLSYLLLSKAGNVVHSVYVSICLLALSGCCTRST
jgi:hypothetical protein